MTDYYLQFRRGVQIQVEAGVVYPAQNGAGTVFTHRFGQASTHGFSFAGFGDEAEDRFSS